MALPTLAELLALPSQQTVLDQEVLPELRTRRARVTDWLAGGVYRAMSFVVARLYVQTRQILAGIAAGGFEDYAFGLVDPPNGIDVTAWAPLVAKQRYRVEWIEATHTKRSIMLTNSSASVYGPLNPGDVILEFTDTGNRYVLDEIVTIPASDGVMAVFRSEFAVDSTAELIYSDLPNASIALISTSYPGVTATNPETEYSAVEQVGSGTGTVMPSEAPTGDHTVAVRIDGAGQVGVATWSTSVDGGTWVSRGTASSTADLGGFGITVTLSNGSTPPSFLADDVYSFSTPGTDLVDLGRDVETPQELGARVRALQSVLAFAQDEAGNWIPVSPTLSGYEALARAASDQVKIVKVVTDGTINGKVLIYVAGQGGLLAAGTIALVQLFFDHLSMLTDLPSVLSPTARTITLAGATVRVRPGQLGTAQAALQTAVARYFAGTDAEQLSLNPLVDHAYLVSLIRRTPGVVGVNDGALTINGAAADLQLPVTPGALELAVWASDVAAALTWEIAD